MTRIVGREQELAALDCLLAPAEAGMAAVVVEGEPGIGKSTIWRAGVGRARASDLVVLSCQPVEAEAKLAFASLADLLAPVVDELLGKLPEPQRLALEVALLRTVPRGSALDRRAVATAVLSLLRRLTAERTVLLAIDDVQWLDRPSAAALAFALRRLLDVPLRVLLGLRTEDGIAPDVLGLDAGAGADADPNNRVRHVRPGTMSLGAIHHVIRSSLGVVFPRPTLRRIVQVSGGNPLFARELARALAETGARPGPGEPLSVPATLSALMGRRLERLPASARPALLAAASLGSGDCDVIAEAVGANALGGLEAAERAGIVTVDGTRVTFTHPMLASTVSAAARPDERRAVHGRLAAVARRPEERARHLALAASSPDEAIAASVQEAARDAARHGALEVAAELAELSCRLTPADRLDERARRTLSLSEYLFRSGDTDRARGLAETVLADRPAGPLRAGALELMARMLHVAGTAVQAADRCQEALAHVGDDELLRARVHATLACVSWHDFELARTHARAALDLLQSSDDPDPEVLGQALVGFIEAEFCTGRGLPMDAVERALALERLSPASSVADRVSAALGAWLKVDGDFDGARRWLEATRRAVLDEGDDGSLPYVIGHMPQLELWTGNWDEAERYGREHLELAEAMAQPDQRRQALYNLSLVHAHQGRVDQTRREAQELQCDAARAGDSWGLGNALSVLGFLELSLGNAEEAAVHLERNAALCESSGRTEPLRSFGDLAEALVELGRLDRAEEVVGTLEARAQAAGRIALLAIAASCRGQLAAERPDPVAAVSALEQALSLHDRVPVPFDRARTLLVLGRVRRRRGERRAASDAFASAQEIFEWLGAPLWVTRAADERARIPLRRRAPDTLTATEDQVARLAAQGKTNREVAQALFISPKTVEANLARVYRKLGIGSRAELGARLAGPAAPTEAKPWGNP